MPEKQKTTAAEKIRIGVIMILKGNLILNNTIYPRLKSNLFLLLFFNNHKQQNTKTTTAGTGRISTSSAKTFTILEACRLSIFVYYAGNIR